MIEIIDMLISLVLECIIFIYYTNSLMLPRKGYKYSNIGIIIGYTFLYIISLYNVPILNVIMFCVVNFTLIYLLFEVKLGNVFIQILVITAIMMFSEGIMSMFTDIGAENNSLDGKLLSIKLIHAILSKLIYFIGIIGVYIFSKEKSEYKISTGFFSLGIIPVFTIFLIIEIMSVFQFIDERKRILFALISLLGVISNIIVYWIYDKTIKYHRELEDIQELRYKNNLELTYCNMLKSKLEQDKIMRHDFKEHINILKRYIDEDNEKAIKYLNSIQMVSDEIEILNYTDNRVLNILLSEKQKLCIEKGITLKIHSAKVSVDFINDKDIVAIFSNLLNNAIESAEKSEKKIIYFNLAKMNDSYLIIKIENSCDKRPVEKNGFYETNKVDSNEHGIGLKSIVSTLSKYGGDIRMQYDAEEKMFSSVSMIELRGGKNRQ